MSIHTQCNDCKSVYSIKRITDTVESPIAHCIFCGSLNISTGSNPNNYWEALAVDLGLPASSHEIVRQIFDIWTPKDGDQPRFIDFARSMIDEAQVGAAIA